MLCLFQYFKVFINYIYRLRKITDRSLKASYTRVSRRKNNQCPGYLFKIILKIFTNSLLMTLKNLCINIRYELKALSIFIDLN